MPFVVIGALRAKLEDDIAFITQQEMCHNVKNAFSRVGARGQGHSHSDPKTVCDTPRPQGVSTHQIWDPYLNIIK